MAAGIYLHVPFCRHVCGYCDFNTYAGMDDAIPRYVAALRADLDRIAAAGPRALAPPGAEVAGDWPVFTSVFMGGGTPTLLAPADLAGLLRHVRVALPVAADAEVTTEANPENITAEVVATLVDAGLTRISIGAQSFSSRVLEFLDRDHDPELPLRAVAQARAGGVPSVNLDLIYGAPAETPEDWSSSMETAVAAGTDHVSAYALTLESGTTYAARVRTGQQAAPDDDVAAERMAVAAARLSDAGLRRYEISNWARPGHESRHNLNYWRHGDWLGVGAGAHGHWRGRRWWSWRSPARYSDAALAGRDTTSGAEIVDEQGRRTERLLLGLRMISGVARDRVEPVDERQVARLVAAGLLLDDGGVLRLTDNGRPLADDVTVRLLPA